MSENTSSFSHGRIVIWEHLQQFVPLTENQLTEK